MNKQYAIYRESDGILVEGGFFSKAAAESYCEREYNAPALEEKPDGTEFYVVKVQA